MANDRDIIPNINDLVDQHAGPQADIDALARQIRAMTKGLLCWPCIQEARVQPGTEAWEWQAVTIVDGTALCAQHVIVKVRQEDGRR